MFFTKVPSLRKAGEALATAVLALLCLVSVGVASGQSARFDDVGRVIAFGDVHGAYDELVALLRAAGVIDARLHWRAGDTHVVSLGDLLDRGGHSRQVMDLLMRLQTEARDSGGYLHVVLGNHEVMNLIGDLRYVSSEEYAAFADDEQPAQRAAAFIRFAPRFADPEVAQMEFEQAFPPGYFGHRAAFAPDGRYGEWLLQLPAMLQIDDTVFVHGGLPPLVAQVGLDNINAQLHRDLREFLSLWRELRDEGLIAFDQAADLAAIELEKLRASETPPAFGAPTQSRIERFVQLSESPVLGIRGPLWYRGSARCHPLLETDVIDAALERLNARRVVVGHTPTRRRRAATRLAGKVVMIDAGMLASYYAGTPVALVIEQGRDRVVYPEFPAQGIAVEVDHDNAADWGGDLGDLEQFLRTTPIVARAADEATKQAIVTLRANDGRQAEAIVFTRRQARRELAAYRLDRVLEVGIVPVTVARNIDGLEAAVQLRRDDWIDESTRVARRLALPDRCAKGNNFELMYIFDALTATDRSEGTSIRYSRDRERLWINDFASAFGTTRGLPGYLKGQLDTLEISGEFARRLTALDDSLLERALGDLLSQRERRALLQRRDAMLSKWIIR